MTGKVDEHGAFHHRNEELCAIGALAMLFFAYFHVLMKEPPSFIPDYSDPQFGQFGRRPWYEWYVFPSSEGDNLPMSYQSKSPLIKSLIQTLYLHSSQTTISE